MKGSFGFEHVLGLRQEVRAVSRDFILARKVGDIRYGKYFLFYRGVEKWMYIGYEDIIWAYRHLEQIRGKRGKGTGMEMHFLMLVTKGKKRIGVPIGEEENALAVLAIIQEHNRYIDIGFSKEKEEKYL